MLTEDQVNDYKNKGFVIVENFLTNNEAEDLKKECSKIVEEMNIEEHHTVPQGGKMEGNDYFFSSAHNIGFFFEEKAFDEHGALKVDKKKALDKIGHGIHRINETFKAATFSSKVKDVARKLGYIKPAVVQSMYIFKHPSVGGKVFPHQDATYLYTEPESVVGFWYALEDVNLENGCLHFIPGSHKGPLVRRMIRNPSPEGPALIHTVPDTNYDDKEFVPAIVKKGSLVLIHGKVIHKSGTNSTKESREVYTFHLLEQHNTKYAEDNWLLPTEDKTFLTLYEN